MGFLLLWDFHKTLLCALNNYRAQFNFWGLRLLSLTVWAPSDVWSLEDRGALKNPFIPVGCPGPALCSEQNESQGYVTI